MEAAVTRVVESDPHEYVDKLQIADKSMLVPLKVFYTGVLISP